MSFVFVLPEAFTVIQRQIYMNIFVSTGLVSQQRNNEHRKPNVLRRVTNKSVSSLEEDTIIVLLDS